MYIYRITNSKTDKAYIGLNSKPDPLLRFRAHMRACAEYKIRKPKTAAGYLRKSYWTSTLKKYQPEDFFCDIIDVAKNKDELELKEKYWIAFYRTNNPKYGYNSTEGGEGGVGYKHTTQTKKTLSKKARLRDPETRKHSIKTKEKIRAAHLGLKFSDQHRKNLSKGQRGCIKGPMTEEHKEKIRFALRGKKKTLEHKRKISLSSKKQWFRMSDSQKKKKMERMRSSRLNHDR